MPLFATMAVIVDLDDSADGQHGDRHPGDGFVNGKPELPQTLDGVKTAVENDRPNPNVNGFSAILCCYPVVSRLASQLDLNTLDALSRSCRQFRKNLAQFRPVMIKHSLHCFNEEADPPRFFRCARDMVRECQLCGTVVCRNCTAKPPAAPALRARHRRICRTCTKAPLDLLITPPRSRLVNSPSGSPNQQTSFYGSTGGDAFTAPAFQRGTCQCEDVVWLCEACGQKARTADTMYMRCWTWRTRYTHYLGGIGTGAGEGNEGVECGRGPSCLVAKAVEQEVDGDQVDHKGAGYEFQEIEGVGGVVKRKAKQQVLVGATVKIYEDEKSKVAYLEREATGKVRSWCSWCERVVPGERDLRGPTDSSHSDSSSDHEGSPA